MTIAQQLNIKKFPFEIINPYGNVIYYEDKDKYWEIKEYDSERKVTYFENSTGYWEKREYDSNNLIHLEDSYGYWPQYEYIKLNISKLKYRRN